MSRYHPGHTYTISDFTPSIEEINNYFRLDEALEQYEKDTESRLSGLYDSYTRFTYNSHNTAVAAASVELRVLQILETKEMLEKAKLKATEKKRILEHNLNLLSNHERAALLTYYRSGKTFVEEADLHRMKKELSGLIGQYFFEKYQLYQKSRR